VEEFGVQTGINAVLIDETKPWLALSPLAETQLVRIVQEALTNVRKHAQARQVEVRLIVPNGVLHVIVTDDGIGIQDHAVERSHFGLQTMRERAESIGGSLLVNSIVGEGTQVEFRLPLANN
jgi:signal transduction histidine kinase